MKITEQAVMAAYSASYGKMGFAIGKNPSEVMRAALTAAAPYMQGSAREQALEEAAKDERIVELETDNKRLREALGTLIKLNDDSGPFGGEMYQDRVDRAWDAARAALGEVKT